MSLLFNQTNIAPGTSFFSTISGGGGVIPDPLVINSISTQSLLVSSINGSVPGGGGGTTAKSQTLLDVKPSGTSGGEGSNYLSNYYKRDLTAGVPALNTVTSNILESAVIPGLRIDIVNNQISVPAGSWVVSGAAPACAVGRNKTRLYNVSDSNVVCEGIGVYYTADNYTCSTAPIFGSFTLTSAKTFEFQHQIETLPISGIPTSNSMGLPMSFAGDNEVYSSLNFIKLS